MIMEEIVLVKQPSLKGETIIKCDNSVRKIEVVFNDKIHNVKSIIIEMYEDEISHTEEGLLKSL